MSQQPRNLCKQFFQPDKGNFAYFAVFESYCIGVVAIGADGIHAQQITGHLKTGDLFSTVCTYLMRLEMTKPDRIEIGKRIIHVIEAIVAQDAPATHDNTVKPLRVELSEAGRQAELMQAAVRAV